MDKAIHTDNLQETIRTNKMIPEEKIFILIAKLLKDDFISLENIWPYLAPNDEDMIKHFTERLENGHYFF